MGADASVGDGWSSISFPALPSLVFFANLILGPFLVLGPVMIATSKTDRLFFGTLLVVVVSLLYMVNSHRTVLFREHGRTSLTLQKWWFLPTFITESRTFDVDESTILRYFDSSDADESYVLLVDDVEVVWLSTKTLKRMFTLAPELKKKILHEGKPFDPDDTW